jgi:hypothetical protein
MKPIQHRVQGPGGLFKYFTVIPEPTLSEIREKASQGINVGDSAVIQAQVDAARAAAAVSQVDAARQAAKSTSTREAPETEPSPAPTPDPE